jgi:hypothetical protein
MSRAPSGYTLALSLLSLPSKRATGMTEVAGRRA